MATYHHRLPAKPVEPVRTPWTVLSELAQLQLRFAAHALNNAQAFWQSYGEKLTALQPPTAQQMVDYVQDSAQRQVLFWDIMRQRGNRFIDYAAQGNPPVLAFAYETMLDAETFEDPCNYALVRITPPDGVQIDNAKRPFVIVDPRAGHVAGIGGFKNDSQVGIALRAGHPVYFVVFKMHPVRGQTLHSVARAETRFLEWVAKQHPQAQKPCVLGNCQGGWAIMGVAAQHPHLTGPLVLSGAPLSYWAGITGKNPMRYMGGLSGGGWLANMMSDIGNGEFDGANLVTNFETLDPANTLWEKYYHLYDKVDSEEKRFLDFERWWGSYIFLTAEEMCAILDNLFIGNKLSHGKIIADGDTALDLRKIKQPVIVFCSQGDNITPPQQALNWIVDLYPDELAIKAAGQVIVYIIHATTGHLGIFVSSAIINREQQQITETLEQIEALPPGLYEMRIIEKGDKANPAYDVRLEERTMDHLFDEGGKPQHDDPEFELVNQVSHLNEKLYRFSLRPWVRALSNPLLAATLRQFHYLRVQHWAISDLNPLLWPVAAMSERARTHRAPVDESNPLRRLEQANSTVISYALNCLRDARDIGSETLFNLVYGTLANSHAARWLRHPSRNEEIERVRVQAVMRTVQHTAGHGNKDDAVLRMLLLLSHARGFFSRSELKEIRQRLREHGFLQGLSHDAIHERLNQQTVIVAYNPELAVDSLPKLLPDKKQRAEAIKTVRQAVPDWLDATADKAVIAIWQRITDALEGHENAAPAAAPKIKQVS